ncbi:TIGR00730 family Rossman fold protein [Anaerolinea thermophila]|uniref:LOG family protein n=4 Tax=Anaerolinea TaxID=233189 RepID=UPI0026F0F4CC|nr:TIGR00730 family Rossman fold protein [Anaerolinea thermophila]
MKNSIQTICVYSGSADHIPPKYIEAAYQTGQVIAQNGMTLVYGGGKTGVMGAVANGALSAGGKVIGVVPHHLNKPQLIHDGLSQLIVTEDMHTRKAQMSRLADAFISLPGGYGTMEEFFETLTWAQIGLHQKPIGLLNTGGYYIPLLQWISHALQEGFIYPEHVQLFVEDENPEQLMKKLTRFKIPENLNRWVER